MLVDNGVHLARIEILEPAPAEVLIGTLLAVLALGEEARLHGLLFYIGLQFLGGFEFVQALEEEEIGNLLNDFQRVGNPTRPKSIPYLINLTADLTSKHRFSRGER